MIDTETLREFRDALQEIGIDPPAEPIANGTLQRCNTSARNGRSDASYILYGDDPVSAWFTNWQTGESRTWTAKNSGRKYTEGERRKWAATQRQREDERAEVQRRAEAEVSALWEGAGEADPAHPYLVAKGIPPDNLKVDGDGNLLVPMCDQTGTILNLQRIFPDGMKRFFPGCVAVGLLFPVGMEPNDPDGQIVVTEGAADAISISKSTGRKVYAGMSAANLPEIAPLVRREHPESQIVIFADHDETGIKYAKIAAGKCGARIVMSPIPGEDANDLFRREGPEGICKLLEDEPFPEDFQGEPEPDALSPIGDKPTPEPDSLVTVRASSVSPKAVQWLWQGRLPLGKMTLLTGDPELGKSLITTSFAATVSTGGTWPGGDKCEPGEVLIYSLEDDTDDTIVPRLMAAGADLDKVHLLKGVQDKRGRRGMNFQADSERISKFLERHPEIRLVIIDPISAILGRIDSNKNAEVRSVIHPVTDIFQAHNVALLGISHNSKAPGGKALMRVLGSVALVAAARMAFTVGNCPDDTTGDTRVMVPTKSNLAKKQPGFRYTIESVILPPTPPRTSEMDVGRVIWGDMTDATGEEALAEPEPATKLAEAVDIIEELLSMGPRSSDEVKQKCLDAGISFVTHRRAKKQLNVVHTKQEGANFGKWYCELPAA